MPDSVSITILREMVRADLELCFEHLNNDAPALALHELDNAREKILQLQTALAVSAVKTEQPCLTLLTLTNDDHQTSTPHPLN